MNKEYGVEVDSRVLAYKTKCDELLKSISALQSKNEGLWSSNNQLQENLRKQSSQIGKYKHMYEVELQARLKLEKKNELNEFELKEIKKDNKQMNTLIPDLQTRNASLFSCLEDAHKDIRKHKEEAKLSRVKFSSALIDKNTVIRELTEQVTLAKSWLDRAIPSMRSNTILLFGKQKEVMNLSVESSLELHKNVTTYVEFPEVINAQQFSIVADWQSLMTQEVKELIASKTLLTAEMRKLEARMRDVDDACELKIQEATNDLKAEVSLMKASHGIEMKFLMEKIDDRNSEIAELIKMNDVLKEKVDAAGVVLRDAKNKLIEELNFCLEKISRYESRMSMQSEDILLRTIVDEFRNGTRSSGSAMAELKKENAALVQQLSVLHVDFEGSNDLSSFLQVMIAE